jgi:hypothetical protein
MVMDGRSPAQPVLGLFLREKTLLAGIRCAAPRNGTISFNASIAVLLKIRKKKLNENPRAFPV